MPLHYRSFPYTLTDLGDRRTTSLVAWKLPFRSRYSQLAGGREANAAAVAASHHCRRCT